MPAPTFTTRLALRKPDPDPSTGDFVNVTTDISASMDKLDAAVGAVTCTAAARPASPYNGQFARETDTGQLILWNGAAWVDVMMEGSPSMGGAKPCTTGTHPAAPFTGQLAFETDTGNLIIWNGTVWLALPTYTTAQLSALAPAKAFDSNAQVSIVSTTFIPGSPVCGITFVVPPSGKVYITVAGWLQNAGSGFYLALDHELRTGGSIGAGTIIHAADAGVGVLAGNSQTNVNASRRQLFTGLTAGSTYNTRTMHAVNAGGSGNILIRELIIEPSLF